MERKLWFRAKNFGWGWQPASWQGWVIMLVYIVLVVSFALTIDEKSHSVSDTLIGVALPFVVLTSILLAICYKTGEKPEWRWGKKE
jgi:uncharacterized membrane protein YhaH (DUF805 family)